ncbi:hypothetical protein AVEN_142587-1 [Araneus ventricosus]|uniref:Gustatory receptor n=1 Tax=Araneus ventricosus TaxID=182803 RepID=A0A4Y2CHT4_ARAVE|nr:hypothetical protein AVEN_142587-1 [Araneus ventricosus]
MFRNFQKQLDKTRSRREFSERLSSYEDILKNMSNFNEYFSTIALIAILIAMMVLFRAGYMLAFNNVSLNRAYGLYFAILFYFTVQLILMTSAFLTNEAKALTGCTVQRYLYKLCNDHFKSEILKSYSSQSILTLGKIYELDRSLIIASLATLITYGILLGTLGK